MRAAVGIAALTAVTGLVAAQSAAAQDAGHVAKCLAIPNVDERTDCLESGSSYFDQGPASRKPGRSGPSFNCRAATNSIERAICGDVDLSEIDGRMGQLYQQVLRARKPGDTQELVEGQRSWIQLRNYTCGNVGGSTISACVMDMTKQRMAVLSEAQPRAAPVAPSGSPQRPQPSAPQAAATVPVVAPNSAKASTTSPSSEADGPNVLLIILFLIGAAVATIAVFGNINRRERLKAEQRQLAAERQRLIDKYGVADAERILARQVWQGMTQEQLIESWGNPADQEVEIRRAKTKETWKYNQIGRNRYASRVFLENGVVIGWKQ